MESVDEGSNVTVAEKKTKNNIGVSQTTSIMRYFQRASLTEASKRKAKKPNSSTTESLVSPLKKCSVGESSLDKLQFDREHENDSHLQTIGSCNNDESYDSCSDGGTHAGGPVALCVGNKMKVCAGENHKNNETDSHIDIANCRVVNENDQRNVNGDHAGGCHGDSCDGDGCYGNGTIKDVGCHDNDTIKDAGCHGNDTIEDSGGKIRKSPQLNAGQSKWNFTWKPKARKAKKTTKYLRDSDSDFEQRSVDSTESQVSHKPKGNRKKGMKKRQTKPASTRKKSLSKDNLTNSISSIGAGLKRTKEQDVNISLEKGDVVEEREDSPEGKQDLTKNPEKEDSDYCDKRLIEMKASCNVVEECEDTPEDKQNFSKNPHKEGIADSYDKRVSCNAVEEREERPKRTQNLSENSNKDNIGDCDDNLSQQKNSKNVDKEDIDNCNDSLIEIESTCSVVEVCEDSSQDKQNLSKNQDKIDIDDGDDIQCTVDENNEDLGENMKSGNGKSFFDVLMQNSREKSCAKRNSLEFISEVTDEEVDKRSRSKKPKNNNDKIGNVQDKDVGTKRRDSRKSTRRKRERKSSVKQSEVDLELVRNDGTTVCKVNNVDKQEAKGNDHDGQICSDGADGVTKKGSAVGSHTEVVSRRSRRNKKESSENCIVVEERENSPEEKQKLSRNPDKDDIHDCDDSLIEVKVNCSVVEEDEDSPEDKQNLSKNSDKEHIDDCDDSLTAIQCTGDNTEVLEENMKSNNGKLGVSEKSFFDVLMQNSREKSCAKNNSHELVSEETDEDVEKQSRSSGKKQKTGDKIGNMKDKDVETKRKDSKKSIRRKKERKASAKDSEVDLEVVGTDGVTVPKVNNVGKEEAKDNDFDGEKCSDGVGRVTKKGSGGGSHTDVLTRRSHRKSVRNKKESSENCTVVEEQENRPEGTKNPDKEHIDDCDDILTAIQCTVDDNTESLEENLKSDNGKLGVSEKSVFDVLMQNSREKFCAKKNSPEFVSEVSDEEMEKKSRSSGKKQKNGDKMGNVKDKDVGTKSRDSKKSIRRKKKRKASAKDSEVDLEVVGTDGDTCSDGADRVTKKGSGGGSHTDVLTRRSHRKSVRNKKESSENCTVVEEQENRPEGTKNPDKEHIDDCDDILTVIQCTVDDNTEVLEENLKSDNGKLGVSEKSVFDVLMQNSREKSCAKNSSPELVSEVSDEEMEKQSRSSGKKQKNGDKMGNVKDKDVGTKSRDSKKSLRRKKKRKASAKDSKVDLEVVGTDGETCSDGADRVTKKGSGGGSHTDVLTRRSHRKSVRNKKESSGNCTVVEERENSPEGTKNPDREHIDDCDDILTVIQCTVDDNTEVLEENLKSDNGKLGVSEKSVFDVLMQNSREKSCAKKNSPGFVSEVTDEEVEKQSRISGKKEKNRDKIGNMKEKDVGTKRRDSKKCTRRKRKRKASVNDSEVDLEVVGNDGMTVCKVNNVDKQGAKDNDFDAEVYSDGGDEVTRKGSGRGSRTEVVTRKSRRRSGRNKKGSLDTMSSLSESNNGVEDDVGQSCVDVDNKKMAADNSVAEKQKKRKRSRRLKNKSEDKASADESAEPPSSSHKPEAKLSSSDNNKSDVVKQERVPKKTMGPIAPIFLPGAWQRAKQKVGQAELLDAAIDVDEISEDPILSSSSQACSTTFKASIFGSTSNNSYLPKDNSQQMQAFMGMFKKSPVKSTVAVVTLIDAPFPKVSHVLQVDDELKEKWNLPMVRNRFVKEEFFLWHGDSYNKSTDLLLLSGLLVIDVQNAEQKTFMWKSLQLKKVTEMSKLEKQAIVKYLKTVYLGFPLRRFIKRCHLQLERCRKAELETESFDRHLVNKGNIEPRVLTKTAKTDNNHAPVTTTLPTSLQAAGKRKKFTKISDKNPISTAERKKSIETKDSPLLLAFRKQDEQNASSKKDDSKNSNSVEKKQLPRKTSLRDYLDLTSKPGDKSDNSITEEGSEKSTRAKRKRGVEVVEIRRGRKKTDRKESKRNKPKKRERESEEDVGNRGQAVEECVKPETKKVKLVQDFKQPKKGRKRKQDREKASESVEIIGECSSAVESVTNSLPKTAKSPKISSGEDFVKQSKNGDEKVARRTRQASRGTGTSNTEETGLRKSSRLRQRLYAKEEIECNENNNEKEGEKESAKEKDVGGEKMNETETKNESSAALDVEDVRAESQVVVEVEKEPPRQTSCDARAKDAAHSLSTVLWTECFRPGRSSEILGNNTAGSKLRNWLSEWKSLREKKLSKMRKRQEKKRERLAARKDCDKPGTEWWYEDDDGSDFDTNDDSGDSYGDEEDILCNTMLLTGPIGCGKTSAVYACAEELGLKVIEVNSSSKRGSKYILSELQEATQSHQVARKQTFTETGLGFAPVPKTVSATNGDKDSSVKATEARKKRNKKGGKSEKKERGEKKSKDESKTTEVVHERMTLILLDEVDVLFGEDKGFWVAVNSIRLNSKRPIVITASDPDVNIDGRFEHIVLKSPSVEHHAVHLQSTCLSKNVFVSPADLKALAILHRGDVRRSLLNLQFWIDSSAGGCDPHGTSFVTELEIESRPGETATKEAISVGNPDEDCEAVSKTKVTNFPCSENTKEDTYYLASSNQTDGEKSSVRRHEVTPAQSVINAVGLSDKVSVGKPEVTLTQCVNKEKGLSNQMNVEKLRVETHEVSQGTGNGRDADAEKMSGKRHGMTPAQSIDNVMDTDGDKLSAENRAMSPTQNVNCVMHQLCLESLLGLRNVTSTTEGSLKVLTASNEHLFVYKCSVASHCQVLGLDIVHCNLETLFPCLFACINGVDDVNVANVTKSGHHDDSLKGTLQRRRDDFSERERESQKESGSFADRSLFDDEADDQNSRTSEVEVVDNTTVATSLEIPECENDERKMEGRNRHETRGVGKKLSAVSLEVFGYFLEDMSFMDSELCCDLELDQPRRGNRFGNWYARVSPGLEDTVDTKSSRLTWKSRTALNEIRGALEVASLERSHKCFHHRIEETGQDFKTKLVELVSNASGYNPVSHVSQGLQAAGKASGNHANRNEAMKSGQGDIDEERRPVGLSSLPPPSMVSNGFEPRSSLQLSSSDEIFISKTKTKREQDYTTITEYLPDFSQLNRSSIALDYLPTLRNMCRNEFLRRASRTKRRFYHYFDLVGLHFLPSAIQLLTDDTFSNCSQDVR